jgi:D-alanyl-D-alanine carboxypeptidase/D-alanyl-D-alanine-endopeptidase (penicillin-binding protein 4)
MGGITVDPFSMSRRALTSLLVCVLGLPASAHAQAKAPASDSGTEAAQALPPRPPSNPVERQAWLKARLDALFSAPTLVGARISVAVVDAETGKVLYGRNERTGLNAASNVKLVTTAAALALLGPEFRWKTAVLTQAPAEGGRAISAAGELQGDLILRAAGDPTLGPQDLAELANDLASLGLRKVRGGLLLDASAFDSTTVGPAYDEKDDSAAFRAPSSAASLNSNAVSVTITPGATAGAPARVVLDPSSPNLIVTGQVITAAKGPAAPSVLTSDAGNGQTRITVSGRVRLGSEPRTLLRRIVLAQTFMQVLKKRGISVDKPIRIATAPGEGLRTMATHDSPTLAVVVHELGKRSNNFVAEQVLRTLGAEVMGRPGTWPKGLDAVARYLDGLGMPKSSYVMRNGSGLYESNRFSAEQIVTLVRLAMRDFRISGEFMASLAVSGADGTLANRMAGSAAERYVRAKTGTLAKVSCLSGVAGAPGQKPLVFSMLMNDVRSPSEARAIQDQATEVMVGYLDPALLERR